MHCLFCSATDTEVYNSRSSGPYRIWRRRRCTACKKTFTTYEGVDLGYLMIAVPGAAYRHYQRHKLFNSIYRTCKDLKQRAEAIDGLTSTVESKLLALKKETIATSEVIKIVLATLKPFSLSAYLHYLADHSDLDNMSKLKARLKN